MLLSNTPTLAAMGGAAPQPASPPDPAPAPNPLLQAPPNSPLQALSGGGDKGKENPMAKEMRILYNRKFGYDNKPASEVVRTVAQRTGVNPGLLFSSAFQEGMNQALVNKDNVTVAYNNAKVPSGYPVDGFGSYGLDTFGQRYNELKKYLPPGFEQRYYAYPAYNEKGEAVKTAAFRTNEDALTAKAAMLKAEADNVRNYAKRKGLNLDDNAMNYFTLASYNGGAGNAQKMMDRYAGAADKKAFIEKGDPNWQSIHKNIAPRMQNIALANQLLSQTQ